MVEHGTRCWDDAIGRTETKPNLCLELIEKLLVGSLQQLRVTVVNGIARYVNDHVFSVGLDDIQRGHHTAGVADRGRYRTDQRRVAHRNPHCYRIRGTRNTHRCDGSSLRSRVEWLITNDNGGLSMLLTDTFVPYDLALILRLCSESLDGHSRYLSDLRA
jgi:hypothetical protein